jgi:Co/Zn/Cd efflux system component
MAPASPAWRRALWIALAINAGMFLVEVIGGQMASSVALQADALDFLGDAANYAIALMVAGMALVWRARAALLKGVVLIGFGGWVAASAVQRTLEGASPQAFTMGTVGLLALAANVGVALMLYRFREGDAIGNIAVVAAAVGVFGTNSFWPDVIVAGILATLGLWGGSQIVRAAVGELRSEAGRSPALPTTRSVSSG